MRHTDGTYKMRGKEEGEGERESVPLYLQQIGALWGLGSGDPYRVVESGRKTPHVLRGTRREMIIRSRKCVFVEVHESMKCRKCVFHIDCLFGSRKMEGEEEETVENLCGHGAQRTRRTPVR